MAKLFNRLKIQGKLLTVLGAVIILGALALAINAYNVVHLNEAINLFVHYDQYNDEVDQLDIYLTEAEGEHRYYLLGGGDTHLQIFEHYKHKVVETAYILALKTDDAQDKLSLQQFNEDFQLYNRLFSQAVNAYDNGDDDELDRLEDEMDLSLDDLYDHSYSLYLSTYESLDTLYSKVEFYNLLAIATGVTTLVLFLLLTVVAALVISRQINQPIEALCRAAEQVTASRSYDVALEKLSGGTDEMDKLVNEFIKMVNVVNARENEFSQRVEQARAKINQMHQDHSPNKLP